MKTYADRSMRDQDHVRFFYDGEQLCRRETPKQVCNSQRECKFLLLNLMLTLQPQLGLINNDIIQVFIEQIGG